MNIVETEKKLEELRKEYVNGPRPKYVVKLEADVLKLGLKIAKEKQLNNNL